MDINLIYDNLEYSDGNSLDYNPDHLWPDNLFNIEEPLMTAGNQLAYQYNPVCHCLQCRIIGAKQNMTTILSRANKPFSQQQATYNSARRIQFHDDTIPTDNERYRTTVR